MKLSVLIAALRLRHLAGAALLSSSLAAYALPAGLAQGPSVEGVTQYTLDNGLRLVLAPDDSKPTTTVNMTLPGAGLLHGNPVHDDHHHPYRGPHHDCPGL